MFRFLVLCAYFAAASAGFLNPVLYSAPIGPLAYNGAIPYAPATTYINPTGYSPLGIAAAPLGFPHLIEKRDNQVPRKPQIPTFPVADDDGSVTVAKRAIAVHGPAAPVAALDDVTSPVAEDDGSFSIKKRSIAVLAPAASVACPDHLIHKRSAIAYAAPAAFVPQPRIGYGSPIIQPYAAALPIGYGAHGYAATPIGYASSYVAPVAV